jgi:DNA polymerase-3 subunit gamma/tau
MSYQVLARKWRPRNFSELAGQEHVQRALINALDNNRLHHAFLFTGTRGVGKTTIARILAKSLNCEKGVSASPCGECSACTEINEGRFIDLIEVDAASKTKVEDTRELLENVQYAPTRGRYKVYLIDEVHMLSAHSFNALLKTLEEPPPHVKFLLATTDPQKLPVTILSRCLQFNLKRLPAELIDEHLKKILSSENVTFEDSAIALISEAADGSMRDALSLLDQAIAYGNGELKETEVRAMLGTFDRSMVFDLLTALADKNSQLLLANIETIADFSADFDGALSEVLTLLHQIALAQIAPQSINAQAPDSEKVLQLAEQLAPEDTQLFYQIGLIGRRDISYAPNPRLGFEMTMLRMLAFHPQSPANQNKVVAPTQAQANAISTPTKVNTTLQPTPATTPAATPNPTTAQGTQSKNEHLAAISKTLGTSKTKKKLSSNPELTSEKQAADFPKPAQADTTTQTTTLALDIPENDDDWELLVEKLPINGVTLNLAKNCALANSSKDSIDLHIAELHQQFTNKQREQALQDAIGKALGKTISVTVHVQNGDVANTPSLREQIRQSDRQKAAEDSIYNDNNIKSIMDTFDGKVLPKSIEPID